MRQLVLEVAVQCLIGTAVPSGTVLAATVDDCVFQDRRIELGRIH